MIAPSGEHWVPTMGGGVGVKTSFNQICDCAIWAAPGTPDGGEGLQTSFNRICDRASGLCRVPTMRGGMKVGGGG